MYAKKGGLGLVKSRRFAPLFATQFLGAFNDNVFKTALFVMIGGAKRLPACRTDVELGRVAVYFAVFPVFLAVGAVG